MHGLMCPRRSLQPWEPLSPLLTSGHLVAMVAPKVMGVWGREQARYRNPPPTDLLFSRSSTGAAVNEGDKDPCAI